MKREKKPKSSETSLICVNCLGSLSFSLSVSRKYSFFVLSFDLWNSNQSITLGHRFIIVTSKRDNCTCSVVKCTRASRQKDNWKKQTFHFFHFPFIFTIKTHVIKNLWQAKWKFVNKKSLHIKNLVSFWKDSRWRFRWIIKSLIFHIRTMFYDLARIPFGFRYSFRHVHKVVLLNFLLKVFTQEFYSILLLFILCQRYLIMEDFSLLPFFSSHLSVSGWVKSIKIWKF